MLEIRWAIGESVNVFLDVHGCKTIHLWIDTIGGKILGRHVYYWQNGELAYERKASATEVEKCYKVYKDVLRKVGGRLEKAYGTWKIEGLEPYKGLDIE